MVLLMKLPPDRIKKTHFLIQWVKECRFLNLKCVWEKSMNEKVCLYLMMMWKRGKNSSIFFSRCIILVWSVVKSTLVKKSINFTSPETKMKIYTHNVTQYFHRELLDEKKLKLNFVFFSLIFLPFQQADSKSALI